MAQEIITYLIVAAAFLYAFRKFYKKFSKKKRDNKLNNEKQHNCSTCSAECILRDQSASTPGNADFCNKTYSEKS